MNDKRTEYSEMKRRLNEAMKNRDKLKAKRDETVAALEQLKSDSEQAAAEKKALLLAVVTAKTGQAKLDRCVEKIEELKRKELELSETLATVETLISETEAAIKECQTWASHAYQSLGKQIVREMAAKIKEAVGDKVKLLWALYWLTEGMGSGVVDGTLYHNFMIRTYPSDDVSPLFPMPRDSEHERWCGEARKLLERETIADDATIEIRS